MGAIIDSISFHWGTYSVIHSIITTAPSYVFICKIRLLVEKEFDRLVICSFCHLFIRSFCQFFIWPIGHLTVRPFGIWPFGIRPFGIWPFGIWSFGIWPFDIWPFGAQFWKPQLRKKVVAVKVVKETPNIAVNDESETTMTTSTTTTMPIATSAGSVKTHQFFVWKIPFNQIF